jgi:hypothetical protein
MLSLAMQTLIQTEMSGKKNWLYLRVYLHTSIFAQLHVFERIRDADMPG